MKKVSLSIDGKTKTYSIPFVNGLVWRKWVELRANLEDLGNLQPEQVDEYVDIIVLAFKDKFTKEEYFEGTPYDQLIVNVDKLFIDEDLLEDEGKK